MIAPAEVLLPAACDFLFEPPLGSLRYRVAYGGRGSAKSWSFARALLIHGMTTPLRILCAREYQSSIRDSVHRLLADQIEAMGFGWFYEVNQKEITGSNGTLFFFEGLRQNINEVKSTEGIDICWVEEAEAVSNHSWEVLIPTIRKDGSEIWVTFNPALPTDPTYRRFVEAPPARSVVRLINWRDNPWLPAVLREEQEELFKRDPEAHANIWEGEPWTRSEAQVLVGKYTVEDFTPSPSWQGPYYGADWGFARDPSVLVRLWTGDRRLWIEYEAGGPQLGMDETAAEFKKVPGATEYTIRGDSARPETINEMCRRGFRVEAADKWEGSVKDGIAHLRSYDQIFIHSRCKRAIQEARLWRYKSDPRTGDVLPKLHEGNDHIWDAVRYALAPLIRRVGIGSSRVQMG